MNGTVIVAIAHMMMTPPASAATVRSQKAPIVAGAAAPVLIIETASACAVPRRIMNVSAMKVGVALFHICHTDAELNYEEGKSSQMLLLWGIFLKPH